MATDVGSTSVVEFFNCIALCNDCISVKENDKISYNGPSVDEVCLMDMALEAGVGYFTDRDSSHVRIQTREGVISF
jgi:magnesium-transporting ATPase (P-type)